MNNSQSFEPVFTLIRSVFRLAAFLSPARVFHFSPSRTSTLHYKYYEDATLHWIPVHNLLSLML